MFSKQELLLFVFSWIKTFKRSFFTFIKYFWWLIAIDTMLQVRLLSIQNQTQTIVIMTAISVVALFSIYFSILSIRSSLETKDTHYFLYNLKKIFGFSIVYIVLFFILNSIIMLVNGLSPQNWALANFMYGTTHLIQTLCALLLMTTAFFLVDHQHRISGITKALSCTIKGITVYFLPFFSIFALYIASYYSTAFICSFLPDIAKVATISMLKFFFICAVAVLYVKIRYCNYKLLFTN